MKIWSHIKSLKMKTYISIIASSFLVVIINYQVVSYYTASAINKDLVSIKQTKVGVLLGTSKYLRTGSTNPFYEHRIKAAIDLYFAGKIKYILVSGDNKYHNYNEPKMMKEDLIKAGVPSNAIYLDYAGFRTLDSIVRAKEVFGQNQIIIISQSFHCERALFIAKQFDIDAYAYLAKDPSSDHMTKVLLREYLARIKLMIDIYILNTKPKFLGEKITIV